jgi:hypothetical protein
MPPITKPSKPTSSTIPMLKTTTRATVTKSAAQMLANQLNSANEFVYPETPDWAAAFQKHFALVNEKLDTLTSTNELLQKALTTNQQLLLDTQRQLAEATARIAVLEKPTLEVHPTYDPSTDPITYGTEHSKYALLPPTNEATAATSSPSASYASKLKMPRPNQPARRNIASIVRTFAAPSAAQGFQYIYVPTNKRCPIKEMRYRLQRLGLGRGRIVDVHYPDHNVVAILVHNDYATEAREILSNKVPLLNDFDPLDQSILRDIKYKDMDTAARQNQLNAIHHGRCISTISYLKFPIKVAVAREFLKRNWITAEEMKRAAEGNTNDSNKDQHDDDNMEDIVGSFQPSNNNSNSTINPSGGGEPASSS